MKKYLPVCIMAMVFAGCNFLSNEGSIENRWDFSFSNAPLVKTAADELKKSITGIDPYQQVFLGSKLVFRGNKQFDMVLFSNYYHGTWQLDEKQVSLQLLLEGMKDPISIKVDSITQSIMQFRIDSTNFMKLTGLRLPPNITGGWFSKRMTTFRLSIDTEHFNEAKDPYSLGNNKWRLKPLQAETEQQLRERVRNHLQFFKLLFEDAIENDRSFVSYGWFVSPLNPAVNGIGLKNYKKVKEGWEACFYDTIQAKHGYDILYKAFDKEIKFPDKEENKYKRSLKMIEQVISNMDQ